MKRSTGYHLCVNRNWKYVTIHGPTSNYQCRPRPDTSSCFWVGPFATVDEAQDVAQDGAEYNDYDVRKCRKCFHVPKATTSRQDRARERLARSGWLPRVGQRKSQGGIANFWQLATP